MSPPKVVNSKPQTQRPGPAKKTKSFGSFDNTIPVEMAPDTTIPPTVNAEADTSNLAIIRHSILEANLTDVFDDFPPADSFTFRKVHPDMAKQFHGLGTYKMFLGGDQYRRVWAAPRLYENKTADVILWDEHLEATKGGDASGVLRGQVIERTQWGECEIMYPFRILTDKPTNSSRSQLNALVIYYFLEAGKYTRLVSEGKPGGFCDSLRKAVKVIGADYARRGGASTIPDTYEPPTLVPLPTPSAQPTPPHSSNNNKIKTLSLPSSPIQPQLSDPSHSMHQISVTPPADSSNNPTTSRNRNRVSTSTAASSSSNRATTRKRSRISSPSPSSPSSTTFSSSLQRAYELRKELDRDDKLIADLRSELAAAENRFDRRKQEKEAELAKILEGKTEEDLRAFFLGR